MAETVNLHAAKTHFSKLVDRAHEGEEIIIAKAGKPYARLVPLAPTRQREFGFLAGQVEITEDFAREAMRPLTEEELADWE
ncbi:type II toxin-antitoxin system Phd/YefM family antitoxin [Deinococcus sp. YIM 134068]|uniref:type II toxin-antitoxin system Phd/YefM family antitoxin n=1 Tax=Deinococcus lichenicola TaxID=3118910 RepID=UPI002F93CC3B